MKGIVINSEQVAELAKNISGCTLNKELSQKLVLSYEKYRESQYEKNLIYNVELFQKDIEKYYQDLLILGCSEEEAITAVAKNFSHYQQFNIPKVRLRIAMLHVIGKRKIFIVHNPSFITLRSSNSDLWSNIAQLKKEGQLDQINALASRRKDRIKKLNLIPPYLSPYKLDYRTQVRLLSQLSCVEECERRQYMKRKNTMI